MKYSADNLKNLKDVKWREPVVISLEGGIPRKVQSVYDAYDFLLHEWAMPIGSMYESAIKSCKLALQGSGCAEIARRAFIEVSEAHQRLLSPKYE